jgi:hypothetical protein
VRSAGGGEDLAEEETPSFAVDPLERIVGPGELDGSLDTRPLPAGADHDGGTGPGAQVDEALGRSGRHERDDGLAGDRVVEHAGIHD